MKPITDLDVLERYLAEVPADLAGPLSNAIIEIRQLRAECAAHEQLVVSVEERRGTGPVS